MFLDRVLGSDLPDEGDAVPTGLVVRIVSLDSRRVSNTEEEEEEVCNTRWIGL